MWAVVALAVSGVAWTSPPTLSMDTWPRPPARPAPGRTTRSWPRCTRCRPNHHLYERTVAISGRATSSVPETTDFSTLNSNPEIRSRIRIRRTLSRGVAAMKSTCRVSVARTSCRRSSASGGCFPCDWWERLQWGKLPGHRRALRREQLVKHKAEKVRRADSMPPKRVVLPFSASLPWSSRPCIGRRASPAFTHTFDSPSVSRQSEVDAPLVTSFSWNRTLTYFVFGLRKAIRPCSKAASVLWFRHWHEVFLYHSLRRRLAKLNKCVIYAHEPLVLTLHCGHGADHTNVSSWQSTTASHIRGVGRHAGDQAWRSRV